MTLSFTIDPPSTIGGVGRSKALDGEYVFVLTR